MHDMRDCLTMYDSDATLTLGAISYHVHMEKHARMHAIDLSAFTILSISRYKDVNRQQLLRALTTVTS